MEGFDLLSKESVIFQGKNANMEGDSWVNETVLNSK